MRTMHATRIPAWGILLLFLACGDSTEPSRDAVRLEISPADVALRIGETRALSATFVDAGGRKVDSEGTVRWASSDETIVAVDGGGEVRGKASGSAKITASTGALSGEVDVLVLLPSGELETDAAVSDTVGPAGGTISATGQDGTRYTLRIPAGAVDSLTWITVTPLDRLEALPLTGGFAVGADFAPDGLEFRLPAELEIVTAIPSGSGRLVGFALNDEAFRLKPAFLSGDTLRLVVGHFSSAGAATGSAEEVSAASAQAGTPEEQLEASIAEMLAEAAEAGGQPDPSELAEALAAWYENSVAPGLASASGGRAAEAAIAAFVRWWETASLLGVDNQLSDKIQAGLAAVAQIISAEIDRLNARCRANNDPSLVPQIMNWASTAALLGLDSPGSGLDFASILAALCQQLVIHSVAFPDTVEEGEAVRLEVVAGLSIDGNPPTVTSPVEVSVNAGGTATVSPASGKPDSGGRFTAEVTARSGQKRVTLDIEATALDLPLPPAHRRVEAVVKQEIEVTIDPERATIITGDTIRFTATVEGAENDEVTWSASGGHIDWLSGLYRAPQDAPGTYQVTATSAADPDVSATAEVEVIPGSKVTPMIHHRQTWTSRASVWAGTTHLVPESQLFDTYSISTTSSGGFASLEGNYSYDEDDSLEEFRIKGTMREYPERTGPTDGRTTFRLLFRISGMPLNLVIKGTCTLERLSITATPAEAHLSVRIHDEPSNNNVDVRTSHRGHAGCTQAGWERTIELSSGIYSLSIANFGFWDVDYDFTFSFEEIEEDEETEGNG